MSKRRKKGVRTVTLKWTASESARRQRREKGELSGVEWCPEREVRT